MSFLISDEKIVSIKNTKMSESENSDWGEAKFILMIHPFI